MSSKTKQAVTVEGRSINVGSLSLKESTYKQFEKAMKKESRIKTLPHLKNIVLTGEYISRFSKGDAYGYLFTKDNENVLVSIDRTEIVAAYKSAVEVVDMSVEQLVEVIETKPTEEAKTVTKANTFNANGTVINLEMIEITPHCKKRFKERFFITDANYMWKFISNIVLNGDYIGITKDDRWENEAHSFSKDGIGVFISLDGTKAYTVYKTKNGDSYKQPKEYIKSLLHQKIAKLQKDEYKINKRNRLKSFQLAREIIDYEERLFRAKTEATKLACKARINALKEEKLLLEDEISKISKEVNQYRKSLIVFT